MGDFAALASFADSAGRRGADAIAISPVHALFAGDPGHYSPYAPSSRIAINPVYAPVDCQDAPTTGPDDLIDWSAGVALRHEALRAAFTRDRDNPGFHDFLNSKADVLRHHAVFEAISTHRQKMGLGSDWRCWPVAFRLPSSEDVHRFIGQNRDDVAFHLYAQWRVRSGLRDAQKAARDSGMAIGLIADLAVGVDPAGSDAWSRQDEMLGGVAIGAPPDEFNRRGQNWGLTTFSPRGLRKSKFSALRDMLAAAFMSTGGVRIDHVMGLARLWLIPEGAEPGEGCYLRFPFDDMRGIVMLESARHRGIVLAEDLGTVPGGFRETLAESGFSGMSVLWFERDGDRFIPPAHWRAEAVAMTTTHDLPTVAGWWRGTDVAWRDRLGIAGEGAEKRVWDRGCLWSACRESGAAAGDMPAPGDGDAIADAVITHVATARSALVILPAEDILALDEQPNIPGTTDEHPNWRRRLPDDAATVLEQPRVADRLARLDRARRCPG
ncbi:MAG TPA: 4-alpha-glucanotransferase [Acidiphilium sp.]